jgi:putative ABC transport system ATP-binding protein
MKKTAPILPLVSLDGVSKIFRVSDHDTIILDHISINIYPGELVLVLGPSGSGKSTFLTVMAGLQPPSSGEVRLFGREVHTYSNKDLQRIRAEKIGFIFQTFHLIESLTALENILLVMQFSHTDRHEAQSRAEHLLVQFGIDHLKHAYPKTMSQGEKQRVAIARSLANNAQLLIADEPTGSLSTQQGMSIIELLSVEAKQHGRGVIVASHDHRIAQYADRVFHLQDGVITPGE